MAGGRARVRCSSAIGFGSTRAITDSIITSRRNRPARSSTTTKAWRSYFKFAFERNPWDRQVSAYHFRYRDTKPAPPFSSYMRRRRRAWINNYEIYSIDGTPCVDFIGRFESLDSDLCKALQQAGVSFDQELPRAKTNFRANEKHYRDYYDDETRKIVADWYAPEIGLLHYEF
jgi:Sulfotransferase family